MILGYKFMKGYHIDDEKACKLAKIEPTPEGRMKMVRVTSRMIDRDEYTTTAVGHLADDPQGECYFIFALDFGDDYDELAKRELDVTGKDTLLRAAEFVLSGPSIYVYIN